MPHARIVPWADPKELDDLKVWFYSDNEREKAIAKVKSYQSRGSQFLPHVIDSTSQLTSAVLLDETNNQVGMNAIRMAYTMALIRFVNGILDPNQQAQFAIPLHRLAQNVGLSSWFVELRHWGTHERELPSIEMLRITTKEALTWLWDHYWNDSTLEELSSEDENEENIEEEAINEASQELKKLQLMWPGLYYDFMHNKSAWQNDNNSLISSSNFVVTEKDNNNNKISKQKLKSPEEKINSYIEEWITVWKSYSDREQFVAQVMEKYNSVLLHMLILKLADFEIHYFKWLLKEYKIQLTINDKSSDTSKDTILSRHFSQWSELERQLVKRILNYVNPKLITSRWNQWNDIFMNNASYLSIVVLKTILKKTNDSISGSRNNSNNSSNNDWRKKKKKKQIFNEQETLTTIKDLIKHLESIYGSSEEIKYEQSFIKTVEEKKPVNNVGDKKREISTDDIFSDLANLKKRLSKPTSNVTTIDKAIGTPASKDQSQSRVYLWEEPETWKPKPFGIL